MTEMIRIKRDDEWKGEDSVCTRFKKCAWAAPEVLFLGRRDIWMKPSCGVVSKRSVKGLKDQRHARCASFKYSSDVKRHARCGGFKYSRI